MWARADKRTYEGIVEIGGRWESRCSLRLGAEPRASVMPASHSVVAALARLWVLGIVGGWFLGSVSSLYTYRPHELQPDPQSSGDLGLETASSCEDLDPW